MSTAMNEVRKACVEGLTAVGFKKRSGHVLTTEISEDILGWVGLNGASNPPSGPLEISPVVGVRHRALEEAVAEIRGTKPHQYDPPTVSVQLGYVTNEERYRSWAFPPSGDLDAIAADLVSVVQGPGRRFMTDHARLSSIVDSLRAGLTAAPGQAAMRLPVGLALLAQPEPAKEEVDKVLAELGNRTDMAAVQLREFAARFEIWAAAGSRGVSDSH